MLYEVITDIVKPLGWNRTTPPPTDADMKYILLYHENNYGLIVESKIDNAIRIVARMRDTAVSRVARGYGLPSGADQKILP